MQRLSMAMCKSIFNIQTLNVKRMILIRDIISVDDTWSIGGKQPQTVGSPIIGPVDGLSGSHNKYESDASPARGDYYCE